MLVSCPKDEKSRRPPAKIDAGTSSTENVFMLGWRRCRAFTIFLLVFFSSAFAEADTRLITLSDGVTVYSGPGSRYRPLAVLDAKTELKAAKKTTRSRNGEFYKVIVNVSEDKKAIGFIPVSARVSLLPEDFDAADLEKFGEVALVSNAVQGTVSLLRNGQSSVQVGYVRYVSPGFFVKAFGGAYLASGANGWVGGLEGGNDALLFRNISGFASFGLGVFKPSEVGAVFEGSTSVNMMMQAAVGLRYNMRGDYSFGLGGIQTVLFNANNSHVNNGFLLTVEMGL